MFYDAMGIEPRSGFCSVTVQCLFSDASVCMAVEPVISRRWQRYYLMWRELRDDEEWLEYSQFFCYYSMATKMRPVRLE